MQLPLLSSSTRRLLSGLKAAVALPPALPSRFDHGGQATPGDARESPPSASGGVRVECNDGRWCYQETPTGQGTSTPAAP